MVPEFDWPQIDTVLLDMDGTLLDLEFDSHFWLSLVPQALSERRAIPFDEARHIIEREYQAVQHTMNWYCFDYWSERLDLDIYRMTSEVGSRARLREDTEPFLRALRDAGLQTILLTNAHPHSLAVKIEHTGLDRHLDLLFSTHTFGYPKEDQRLWQAVQQHTGFNPQRTLFVDDGEPILDAARTFGIRYCLGVQNPDSSTAEKSFQRHPSLRDYRLLIPALVKGGSMKEKATRDDAVRLDKWLWAARFYKTRALAREMIDGGKVHYNGQRGKPSKIVELNAELKLRQGNEERTVIVLALTSQRRGAGEAQQMYQETEASIANREKMALARKMNALTMPHPDRRPDKKERRDLMKFKFGEPE